MSKLVIGRKSLLKACLEQYRIVRNKGDRTIQIAIMGDDPTQYTFKIEFIGGDKEGDEGFEFSGGQYMGIIHQKSLEKPPNFMMYTPNGVIQTNTEAVCVSISKYHSQNYRPELGLYGYLVNIVVAILCWKETGHGIGLLFDGNINPQVCKITNFASKSHEWNAKHKSVELAAIAEQSLTPNLTKQLNQLNIDDTERQCATDVMKKKLDNKKATKRVRPTRTTVDVAPMDESKTT